MEYNYNNTMTISTSGPKNEMNARWALQNTLEGKALVYNECIKPLVGNRPLCEGVTLRLGDKPEQEADTEVFLVPGINDDGEAVLKNMKTGEKKKISLNDDFVDTYITAVTEQEDAMPITF